MKKNLSTDFCLRKEVNNFENIFNSSLIEKNYLKLSDCLEFIKKKSILDLPGGIKYNIVLIIGPTGTGKSTLMHYLLNKQRR